MPLSTRSASGAIAAASVLSIATLAEAHQLGLSRGSWTPQGARLEAELTLARAEVLLLAPAIDTDHDGAIGAAEAERAGPALQRALVDRIVVEADGAPCPGTVEAGPGWRSCTPTPVSPQRAPYARRPWTAPSSSSPAGPMRRPPV